MKRFHFERQNEQDVWGLWGHAWLVYDRQRGAPSSNDCDQYGRALARCKDPADAQRICDLLNAAEASPDPARSAGGGNEA